MFGSGGNFAVDEFSIFPSLLFNFGKYVLSVGGGDGGSGVFVDCVDTVDVDCGGGGGAFDCAFNCVFDGVGSPDGGGPRGGGPRGAPPIILLLIIILY